MDAFVNLVRLRWLDLSENRLRQIQPGAFRGLNLQHLFLNGNRDIRLIPGSFDGLATSGLYLHDCALSDLQPEVLSPLIASSSNNSSGLVNLWLNGNRLTVLDRRLSVVFSRLSLLRLGGNPLRCNCEARWLRVELYEQLVPTGSDGETVGPRAAELFRGVEPPTCDTPARHHGVSIGDLRSANDLVCQSPTFGNIDVQFDGDVHTVNQHHHREIPSSTGHGRVGRLRCSASGDPAPTIYWIRPSGKAVRYDPPRPSGVVGEGHSDHSGVNEGVLVIEQTSNSAVSTNSISGMYICVANNEAGNVTLTVNVSWSDVAFRTSTSGSGRQPAASVVIKPLSAVTDRQQNDDVIGYRLLTVPNEQNVETESPSTPSSRNLEPEIEDELTLAPREFTGIELATAVIGTHVTSLIAVGLTLVLCRWRRRKQMSHTAVLLPRPQNETATENQLQFNNSTSVQRHADENSLIGPGTATLPVSGYKLPGISHMPYNGGIRGEQLYQYRTTCR